MNACVLVHCNCCFTCQLNLNVWADMVLRFCVLHVKNRSLIVLPGLQALSWALPFPLSFPAASHILVLSWSLLQLDIGRSIYSACYVQSQAAR